MENLQIKSHDYTIDYLSGIIPTPFVSRFFKLLASIDKRLSFSRFKKWTTGINFYKERYCLNDQSYFVVGFNEVPKSSFLFGSAELTEDDDLLANMKEGTNYGIYLSISGDGLRFLGDKSTKLLFQCLHGLGFKCTRIDLACDVYDPNNMYVPLLQQALANVYYQRGFVPGEYSITTNLSRQPGNLKKFNNADNIRDKALLQKIGVEVSPGCYDTINYTWGRKDSTKCQFRLYDKWLEVATSRRLKAVAADMLKDIPTNYWYRFEYEMHYAYAFDIFNSLASGETTVPAAFAFCAEDCFFPVMCGFGLTRDLNKQQASDIWEDFVELAKFYGVGEVQQTIHFVSKRFYTVEDRLKYVKSNLPIAYMTLMLLKSYPGLLEEVLSQGRDSFINNVKNAPLLDYINKRYFDTNIFARRDIYSLPNSSFEQLKLDSLLLDFPSKEFIYSQKQRLNI